MFRHPVVLSESDLGCPITETKRIVFRFPYHSQNVSQDPWVRYDKMQTSAGRSGIANIFNVNPGLINPYSDY